MKNIKSRYPSRTVNKITGETDYFPAEDLSEDKWEQLSQSQSHSDCSEYIPSQSSYGSSLDPEDSDKVNTNFFLTIESCCYL